MAGRDRPSLVEVNSKLMGFQAVGSRAVTQGVLTERRSDPKIKLWDPPYGRRCGGNSRGEGALGSVRRGESEDHVMYLTFAFVTLFHQVVGFFKAYLFICYFLTFVHF